MNAGVVRIDPEFFNGNAFVGTDGKAHADTFVTGLAHELGHALSPNRDNWTLADLDGDNIRFTNPVLSDVIGTGQQSYTSAETDRRALEVGRDYLLGKSVHGIVVDRGFDITSETGVTVDTVNTNFSSSTESFLLIGAAGANTYRGGSGNDVIYGEGILDSTVGSADRLYGNDGNDWLYGGGGNDELYGGRGNDVLNAEYGRDVLRGGPGNDDLLSGQGGGSFYGEGGSDWFIVTGQEGVLLDGGPGHDKFELSSTSNALVVITGQTGNDWVLGSTLTPVIFTATAGDGRDIIDVENASNYLSIDLSAVSISDLRFVFQPQVVGDYFYDNLDGLATQWSVNGDLVISYGSGSILVEDLVGTISYPEQGEEGSPQVWPGLDNTSMMEFSIALSLTVSGQAVYVTALRYNPEEPFDTPFSFELGTISGAAKRAIVDFEDDRPSTPDMPSALVRTHEFAQELSQSDQHFSSNAGLILSSWNAEAVNPCWGRGGLVTNAEFFVA